MASVMPTVAGISIDDLLFVDIATKNIVIKQTDLLGLIDQKVTATLSLTLPGGVSMSLDIEVKYFTNGPSFVKSVIPPPLTCTQADKTWFFFLSEIIAKDQQVAVITFLPGA